MSKGKNTFLKGRIHCHFHHHPHHFIQTHNHTHHLHLHFQVGLNLQWPKTSSSSSSSSSPSSSSLWSSFSGWPEFAAADQKHHPIRLSQFLSHFFVQIGQLGICSKIRLLSFNVNKLLNFGTPDIFYLWMNLKTLDWLKTEGLIFCVKIKKKICEWWKNEFHRSNSTFTCISTK